MTAERIAHQQTHRTQNVVNHRSSARKPSAYIVMGATFAFLVCGCSVQEHRNGQAENVHLHTPLGGLDVRTNSLHGSDVGLPVYPGATEMGTHGGDSGSADIHMNFGRWRLNVKAIEYQSADPEDKVVAFYKNAMGKYGDVLTCKERVAVGEPAKTSQGLTCADDHEYDVHVKVDSANKPATVPATNWSGDIKLLAGSPGNQHIVEFSPGSKGTKFSIVALQFPHKDETD